MKSCIMREVAADAKKSAEEEAQEDAKDEATIIDMPPGRSCLACTVLQLRTCKARMLNLGPV